MQLIKHLGVDYYEMASLKQPGSFKRVLHSVLAQMRRQCDCYGISLDLDAMDPLEAPGVGTPEPHALKDLGDDAHLVGIEIAEYNPLFDKHQQTLRLIIELVTDLFGDAIKPKRLLGLSSTGMRSTSRLMFNSATRR
jgi:arginase